MSPPCKGGAKPTQLNPLKWSFQSGSNQRPADYKSAALPTELWKHLWVYAHHILLGSHNPWSGRQGSNLRPRTWKERALPTELLPLKSVVADITPEVTTHILLFAVPTGFEPVSRTVTGWNCNHSTTGPNYGEFHPKLFTVLKYVGVHRLLVLNY